MTTKVFHFILDHRLGGPHVYVQNLVKMLPPDIKSSVVTTRRGPLTDITLLNLRHQLRWLYPVEIVLNAVAICLRFWRLKSSCYIIFDVHGAVNLAPIVAARIMNIPVVWHFHESRAEFISFVNLGKRLLAGLPHRVVVVAKKTAEVFSLSTATLIPGAVDLNFWSSVKSDPSLFHRARRFRILSVGNLNPLKGADVLLAALENCGHPWELVIVGAELETYHSYAEDLRKHAERLKSSARQVYFAGWQTPEEVRRFMVNSDVFVLPSRSEACPLVLLEAMAAGCVCIATDVGDVREILETGGCGIVVPSESLPTLVAAIEHIAEIDTAERLKMGKLAQQAIAKRHSLQAQADHHLGIYKQLASISLKTT